MSEPFTTGPGIKRLILGPALVTLAVTAARLVGELLHGPRLFFNPDPGGPWAIVGIIWLAPVFGVYFGWKLAAQGHGPRSASRAVGFSLLGAAALFVFCSIGSQFHLQHHFKWRLLYICAVVAVAALIARRGWAQLFRPLLAYAYAARVPVALVMLFALWKGWGTHYDAVPPDFPEGLGLAAKYLWFGVFTQLIFWVGITVLVGMLGGSLAAAIAQLARGNRPASTESRENSENCPAFTVPSGSVTGRAP